VKLSTTDPAVRSPRPTDEEQPAPPPRTGAWRLVLLLVGVVALAIAARLLGVGALLASARAWIASLGPLAPLAFVAVYAVAVVAMVPGSALTVAAGALFGSVLGVALVSVASTLGAALAFLVSRYFARGAVERWLQSSEQFCRLDALTEAHGAVMVAITRLVPLFPFNLLNYGFGLTRVRFGTYVLWSWLCMLPGTVLYVVGADALTRALREGRVPWALVAVVAGVAGVLSVLVRRARRRLDAPQEVQSSGAPRAHRE